MQERYGVCRRILAAALGGAAAALVVLGFGTGCGEDDPSSPLDSPSGLGDLRIVAGNNQTGKPGEPLKQPLTVQAVGRQGGVVAGVSVRFAVTAGEGVLFDSTDIPAAVKVKVTGSDGRAQMHLILGPSPGIDQVEASVAGLPGLSPTFTAVVEGEALENGVSPQPGRLPDADHFSLAVETLNLPGGVQFGLENRITVFLFDASSNPVGAGTVVRFRTSGGGIEESARTDASGRASVTLTTAEPVPADGWVTVMAETTGEGDSLLTAQTRLLFSGPTVVRLIQPANFVVGAGESQAFLFFVGDANGNPLAAGTTIRVRAEGGTIVGQTDFTLADTQSPDATRFAVIFQAAETGEAPQMSIEVTSPNGNREATFISGAEGVVSGGMERVPAELFVVAVDTVLVADGISTTRIRTTIRDSAGNGVPNQTVQFAASAGAVDATALTDAAGQATVVYRSAANPAGVQEAVVTALAGELTAATTLRLLGVRLILSASPEDVVTDGIAQSTVTATLTTEEGAPIPFVPVDFAVALGTLSAERVETDVTGRASVVYTGVASSEDLAEVEVRARASGLDASVGLQLLGVQVSLTASPDTIAADGNAQATIIARLQRTDGMSIANGVVRFETTLGRLSSEVAETDAEGRAQTILVAGMEAGKATVKAIYGEELIKRTAVAFVKGPPASIVVIDVEPTSIGVQGAGANETAMVTFEVRDARGNTVADGEPVFFRLDAPGAGGERVGPDSTATVNGQVQAALSSGTLARTVRLIAEAPLASGDTVRSMPAPIAIHGGLPDQNHFSLAAKPVNLAGRVLFGLESTITAYVFDKYSNPVQAGASVRFRTDGGGVQGAEETDEDGQASVTLFTALPIPPAPAYLATVIGQTVDENGREIEAAVTVLFSGPTAPVLITGARADIISAGGLSIDNGGDAIVTFRVSDISDNPLMEGSTIRVTSDVAMISGDADVVIPDARGGHIDYSIIVADPAPVEEPEPPPQSGSVLITVGSPNGNRQYAFGVTVD